MDKWNQQLFETIKRCGDVSRQRQSKAASVTQEEPMVTISMKEYRELLSQDGKCANTINQTVRKSKAASVSASGINKNQAKVIHDFLNRR